MLSGLEMGRLDDDIIFHLINIFNEANVALSWLNKTAYYIDVLFEVYFCIATLKEQFIQK